MLASIRSGAGSAAFAAGTRVLTIAEPAVRSRLNIAVEWSVKSVHAESVSDAISVAMKESGCQLKHPLYAARCTAVKFTLE